jgi:hypothetical protein
MNTAKKNEAAETVDFLLRIIYGDKYVAPIKKKRINDFWAFCHSTFWGNENFTPEQIEEFKSLIAEHFKGAHDINAKFLELVERAVLVKRYLRRREGRYIAKPADWFNINFMFGLSGTARWYKELAEQRKTVPHYNEGIGMLAAAILQYSMHRKTSDVTSQREQLIAAKQIDLAQLYMNAVVFMDHLNKISL